MPENADTAWRQRSIGRWLQAAAASSERDLLVTGQSPLGEVLAAPCAPHLDAIAVALLEVEDRSRFVRLEQRDPGKWSREAKRNFVGWARWHRAHAADPHHAPEVLTTGAWPAMRWDRWSGWQAGDPRWCTDVFNTSRRTVEESAGAVADWIARVRSDSAWPLRSGWGCAEH